ncbi:unnamed protein product [Polarella glacialis]|uniref:Uncharacterized protein n=1 Tax=Polarella glacialis TaxID=89957 RepID=A0A813FRM0_POLGL|nr:unnamed protein product [Polarella glacialis]
MSRRLLPHLLLVVGCFAFLLWPRLLFLSPPGGSLHAPPSMQQPPAATGTAYQVLLGALLLLPWPATAKEDISAEQPLVGPSLVLVGMALLWVLAQQQQQQQQQTRQQQQQQQQHHQQQHQQQQASGNEGEASTSSQSRDNGGEASMPSQCRANEGEASTPSQCRGKEGDVKTPTATTETKPTTTPPSQKTATATTTPPALTATTMITTTSRCRGKESRASTPSQCLGREGESSTPSLCCGKEGEATTTTTATTTILTTTTTTSMPSQCFQHLVPDSPLLKGGRMAGQEAPLVFLLVPSSEQLAEYIRTDPAGPFAKPSFEWPARLLAPTSGQSERRGGDKEASLREGHWADWGFEYSSREPFLLKADWHSVQGWGEEFDIFVPRVDSITTVRRAPPRLLAFLEAFREANDHCWQAIIKGLEVMKAEQTDSPNPIRQRLLDLFLEQFRERGHFGAVEAQAGPALKSRNMRWHFDGATGLLHLGITLGRKGEPKAL